MRFRSTKKLVQRAGFVSAGLLLSVSMSLAAHPKKQLPDNPDYISNTNIGSSAAVIAIIDGGIDYNHRLLKDHLWTNLSELPGNVDHDGNGYAGDIHGWDFKQNDAKPFDHLTRVDVPAAPKCDIFDKKTYNHLDLFTLFPNKNSKSSLNFNCLKDKILHQGHLYFHTLVFGAEGHGTHVAGIAQRVSKNGVIMPVRIDYGHADRLDYAARSVQYAVDNGARIVNMSFGMYDLAFSESDRIAMKKIEMTIKSSPHVLFVMAAGNDNYDLDRYAYGFYPGAMKFSNTLTVGAIDSQGELADFSNVGEGIVDVYAPGVQIESTWPGNTHKKADGTSMAAPFISGFAGRILSSDLSLTGRQLKNAVLSLAKQYELTFIDTRNTYKYPIKALCITESDL